MNENENSDEQETPGFFGRVVRDDGVQRAAAGIVVAAIIAVAKDVIFGTRK